MNTGIRQDHPPVEAELRRDRRIVDRAMELVLADAASAPRRQSIARQINALSDELQRVARHVYGAEDAPSQVSRLMDVARSEITRGPAW